jgi:hypothetical protein
MIVFSARTLLPTMWLGSPSPWGEGDLKGRMRGGYFIAVKDAGPFSLLRKRIANEIS